MPSIIKVDQIQSDQGFVNVSSNLQFSSGFTMLSPSLSSPTLTTPTTSGVMTLGAGIKFPATQVSSADANTLDDYEEGTWTPNVIGVGGTGGGAWVSATEAIGYYTKTGNMVTAAFVINNATVPTYTGLFGLALPFESHPLAEYRSGDVYFYTNANFSTGSTFLGMTAYTYGTTYVLFNVYTTNSDRQTAQGTTTTGRPAAAASLTYLRFNITYRVA